MSYAIYKTRAFVARCTSHGDASLDVVLFTRELGKITVRVQSGRKIESKMRMHLSRYAYVTVDVVRGAHTWRLTGISSERKNPFQQESFLRVWHRIFGLVEFLTRGEEAHLELFDFLADLYCRHDLHTHADGLELFGVIHVLDMLGYWGSDTLDREPTTILLEDCVSKRKFLVPQINQALEATQIVI